MKFLILLAAVFCLTKAQNEECGEKPEQRVWNETTPTPAPIFPIAEGRIIAGRTADAHSWPWQISLQFSRDDKVTFRHTCGAVLIDEWWILTAAHCTDQTFGGENRNRTDYYRVLLGGHNHTDVTASVSQYLEIDMIIMHPKYDGAPLLGYPNDLCMLRLKTKANIAPAEVGLPCVPTTQFVDYEDNPHCWISGWGKMDFEDAGVPDILQEAKMIVVNNTYCEEIHIGFIRDTHICVGLGMPNACSGDSGGPLTCMREDGRWWIAGITSYGVVPCDVTSAVYTRVSKYWEWIALMMADFTPAGR
eukprot:GHVU01166032.1.p1 GENE.GHVU01166032.1~~GHVU01166032.1.p1  ORF type:complete len:304 (-),score=17.00 GHVU01166032.1:28-939(-)